MATCPYQTDADRLRRLLDDRLAEPEQAELTAHLETCAACRDELEGLAAGSRLWGDLRLLRAGADHDVAPPTVANPHAPGEDEDPEGDAEDAVRAFGFLDPPSEPGHLGRLGPYDILGVVGRGGMGIVLKARDRSLDRLVAVKVLTPGMASGGAARRRFAREAKAAAAVVHEHVVAIHAVDATPGGLPYLVMQYVAGRSLQERLDRDGAPEVREILRIGMQAATALAAAHAQGLIHRDVKPANILLENGVERVKITDFGLARAIDDDSMTQSGVVAGTPQYMAPEQARGEAVDHRADLFSLGSVLYALCTGRAPFRGGSSVATLKRVCEDAPTPIRELNPDVPTWLVRVVARLHSKDPADRYASASMVADLLERCLAHVQQPDASPLPAELTDQAPARRVQKKWAVAAGLALALTLGLAGSRGTAVAQQVADYVATVVRISTQYGTLVVKTDDPNVKVQIDDDEVVVTGAGPQEIRLRPGNHQVRATRDGVPIHEELISITRGVKQVVSIHREPNATAVARFTGPRGRAGSTSETEQTDSREPKLERGQLFREQAGIPGAPTTNDGAPSPETTRDARKREKDRAEFRQSMIERGYLPRSKAGGTGAASTAAEAAARALKDAIDAGRATTGNTIVVVPDQAGGGPASEPSGSQMLRMMESMSNGAVLRVTPFIRHWVWCIAFSPDGKYSAIASGRWDAPGALRLREVSSGRIIKVFPQEHHGVRFVAFAPDGKTLAQVNYDATVMLRDVPSGRVRSTFGGHTNAINHAAYSPDGKLLATASQDRTVKLWDAESGREVRTLAGDTSEVWTADFSPDGKTLASGAAGGLVRLWDVATGRERAALHGHKAGVHDLAFSPDGKVVATGSWDKTIRLWDAETNGQLAVLDVHKYAVKSLAFSPDGKYLVSGSGQEPYRGVPLGEVLLWELFASPGSMVVNVVPVDARRHPGGILSVAFAPDGKRFASTDEAGMVTTWSLSGRVEETLSVSNSGTSFTPGGTVHPTRPGGAAEAGPTDSPDEQGEEELARALRKLAEAKRLVRSSNDPSVVRWENVVKSLRDRLTGRSPSLGLPSGPQPDPAPPSERDGGAAVAPEPAAKELKR